jgi:hypothetical protein
MNDLFGDPPRHDAGGLICMPMSPALAGSAIYGGANGEYRYTLSRTWDPSLADVLVVMMNPSTAGERTNDPTVAKVTKMAARWWGGAFGTLYVGNVFAYRATDQSALGKVADPIGPENDRYLVAMAAVAKLVVFAYGQPKVARLRSRGLTVARMLRANGVQPHVLRLSQDGTPWHPLYLPDNTGPLPWELT